MVLGYIRVSTIQQEIENQQNIILQYAHNSKLEVDDFISVTISSKQNVHERKITQLLDRLNKGDTLILTELSRLGRSVSEVVDIVNKFIDKGIRLICIKQNVDIKEKHSIQSKVMITMFSLFSELERDLIGLRTKEALATKKANGIKLGRPKGPGKSKLDKHKEEIQELIDKEVSILSIAKIFQVTYPTAYYFIKKRKMIKMSNM